MVATVVHTTGVNWEGTIATVASVTVIAAFVFTMLARYVSSQIKSAIAEFRFDVLRELGRLNDRILRIETTQQGKERRDRE